MIDILKDREAPSEAAVWIVAFRCLERHQICLPCMLPNIRPADVNRALGIVAQNRDVALASTLEICEGAKNSLTTHWEPRWRYLRQTELLFNRTMSVGEVVGVTRELLQDEVPTAIVVDPQAASILGKALLLEATFAPPDQQAEAQYILTSDVHFLRGSTQLAT